MDTENTAHHIYSGIKRLYFFIAAITVFFVMVLFLIPGQKNPGLHDDLRLAVPLISLAALFSARWLAGRRLRAITPGTGLVEKLQAYRASKILKLAALEGAVLLNGVVYNLTGSLFYIGFTAVLLIIFFLERPNMVSLVSDIPLGPDEQARLNR